VDRSGLAEGSPAWNYFRLATQIEQTFERKCDARCCRLRPSGLLGNFWGPGLIAGPGLPGLVIGLLMAAVIVVSAGTVSIGASSFLLFSFPFLWIACRPRVRVTAEFVTVFSQLGRKRIPRSDGIQLIASVQCEKVRYRYGARIASVQFVDGSSVPLHIFPPGGRPWCRHLGRGFLRSPEEFINLFLPV
jgi:hypothetical protein